ncbi:MAG TPA: glycosyl hydrolase family 28 protein [Polyangiaceae bacterium]|jgi:polygalacturonase
MKTGPFIRLFGCAFIASGWLTGCGSSNAPVPESDLLLAQESVIAPCDASNLTDTTCLPPEPKLPSGCFTVAAPRTVTPTVEGGTNTFVPEGELDYLDKLDNSLITPWFAQGYRCVELATGPNGANAFLIGQLKLTSYQTLVIDKGVTVYASRNPLSYGAGCVVTDERAAVTDTAATGDMFFDCGGVIMATGDHVAIMGEGTIDGQGGEPLIGVPSPTNDIDTAADPAIAPGAFSWWNVSDFQRHDTGAMGAGPGSAPNPALVRVDNATNFVLYKVHLYNSPFFHVELNSDRFLVWGVDIHTPYGATSSAGQLLSNYVARNTDGIDPGAATGVTQNGYIVGTTISTGDDMIALKGLATGGANNIVIAHNHFGTGHGMSIGSGTILGVTNVHVYDLTMDGDVPVDPLTSGSDINGLRIKSYAGAGGWVRDILFEDVCTRDEAYPIDITASYTANPMIFPLGVPPDFEDITVKDFHQIDVNGPQHATEVTVDVEGDTTHTATVTFDNVWVEQSHGKKGGPVLTVASTATLTGTMNTGAPPAGSDDSCAGKSWWPTAPTIP